MRTEEGKEVGREAKEEENVNPIPASPEAEKVEAALEEKLSRSAMRK